jgi:hypothetical protein
MLKKRLAMLRRESGAEPLLPASDDAERRELACRSSNRPEPKQSTTTVSGEKASTLARTEHETSKPPLAGRLLRRGRRLTPNRRKAPDDAQLATDLGAAVVRPGLLCRDSHFPLHHHHGDSPLAGLLTAPAHLPLPPAVTPSPQSLVFFDTETTGLSGGVGTLVFMIGLARLDGEQLLVRQLMLTTLAAETAMLELAGTWCDATTTGVSYNGLSFDLPLLAARCRLSGVEDRFSAAAQIDLLHPVRRAFAESWGSCRLAVVEQRLLRFRRDDDLPGSEAPAAWLALLQRGDASRLGAVLRHNRDDLLSLAALLPTLDQVYRDPARYDANLSAIARHWAAGGQERRARELLQAQVGRLDRRGRRQLAYLYRRNGQWPEACALWEPLAAADDAVALEALAKYHEHQCKDFATALDYALRLPPSPQRKRRCTRLSGRLARATAGGCNAGFNPGRG